MTTDSELPDLIRRSRRTLSFVVGVISLVLVLALGAVGILSWQVIEDGRRLAASCSFYSDLGQAPLSAQSSALAVQIIVDSRDSFHGDACPGTLPAPSPELLRLAAAYQVTVRY